MTARTAAARYARALFDVSVKEADPQQVERELAGFADLVSGHATLQQALTNPAVPAPRKRALVQALLSKAGRLSPPLGKLLLLLAARDRLGLLPHLVEAYRARLRDHLGIVQADVVSAAPLPAERLKALERRLARATGRQMALQSRVDPSIVGGVVARIGSVVYDGSVARQLENMRKALAEQAT
jgi:F-type H+-transporting ATPase subunit delta